MAFLAAIAQSVLAQRGVMFCWVPVCLAIGIGLYFQITWEPSVRLLWGLGGVALLGTAMAWRSNELVSPVFVALTLVLIGFVLAGVRANQVAGPRLEWRYYGAVEGRIVAIDRSASDALRLTLDQVVLERVPPHRTPKRVRLSLHGDRSHDITAAPGMRVALTGHLSPPGGPVEPGGFDFGRHAWFAGLGAVGYARTPLMGVEEADAGRAGLAIFRVRMALSAHVQSRLPGDIGGFAAALTTGDRSAMSQQAIDALRASNLAHLLAISGLHMGLMSGVVFGALRLVFALVPPFVLRWPARSIAAAGALLASAFYLALSGGNVATERAFIMVAVALCALMLNRRALSLRAVAIAATLVLILRPEALLGPGFQMSFAATTALVAIFGWLREAQVQLGPRWIRPAVAVFISSAIAGAATAPVAAAHFNAYAQFGLIANLLSVPLMGILVIPAAVVAAVLSPLGLEMVGLWPMGLGLRWILGVADFVSGIEGARLYVKSPDKIVLPVLASGALFVMLWRGRLRWAGGVAMLAAAVLWVGSSRPTVLIADTGTLVGVLTPSGRALSKEKGAGFIARNWLENDGDGRDQWTAAQTWAQSSGEIVHLAGKRAVRAFEGCRADQIVISAHELPVPASCRNFTPDRLRSTGAVALYARPEGGYKIVTAREISGHRHWSGWRDTARTTARKEKRPAQMAGRSETLVRP
ncbi:ComEC/Rec2 family competence protein [Sulfitobacter sp. S190]|uniref:ComEC/Rec2 family competence protein n=1 Tax=Sulfitobacter sp. S190 TaxID=2867022 RepID=UPI0021A89435|nr:ComEC/Rec2 family competence protein [Sulfitobacter sp. S190]UWR23760.1 ComEC family competence protein [Sulfitobacter sp. S190]